MAEAISPTQGRAEIVSSDTDDNEDEELDPRIQIELEKLNSSTDVINKLELDLEEARHHFQHLLNESSRQLEAMSKQLGSAVERSRCYYDARMEARKALAEAQHAAVRFEKASSAHEAAKEMVTLAEEGYAEKGLKFDSAWQEMLNHATNRVNESEKEKDESASLHKKKYRSYQKSQLRVQLIERTLKKSINKSRPYFESKAKFNQRLDDQKRQVEVIEETIQMTKLGYSESLRELEKISEEIHERRIKEKKDKLSDLGPRGQGVGAEEIAIVSSEDHCILGPKLPSSGTGPHSGVSVKRSTSYHRVQSLVRQYSKESAKFGPSSGVRHASSSSPVSSKEGTPTPGATPGAATNSSEEFPLHKSPTFSHQSPYKGDASLGSEVVRTTEPASTDGPKPDASSSSSSSTTASPASSPGYETLDSEEDDDWQKVGLNLSSPKFSNSDAIRLQGRRGLQDPRVEAVRDGELSSLPHGCGEDLSDAESLARELVTAVIMDQERNSFNMDMYSRWFVMH
eukprot:maker-scaffold295_size218279-snap-gene-1.30 protein:Tk09100 transcript:maker-scaffold295_size218279-snap-gene-1.30-mRNA-1 annotation:"sh3 domain-binding protein 5-like protein"